MERKTKAGRGKESSKKKKKKKKDDLKGGVCGLLCRMPTQGQRRPRSWFNIQNE